MKVVGYARVSTAEQAGDGVSLAAQVARIGQYAQLHDLDLLGVEVDAGLSARSLDRPALERALARLADGEAGGLVVFKFDRLTRSIRDWSSLIDRFFGKPGGPSLLSVSDSIDTRTAAGRLVLNVMMTVAEWEVGTIQERTQGAMDWKRSRGERVSGRLPYGSDLAGDGKTLVENLAERAVLEAIRGWRAEGLGARAIAARLNEQGIPSKSGGRWSHSTVQGLVERLPRTQVEQR